MEGRGERKTRGQNSPNLETRGLEGDGWPVEGGEEGSLVLGDVEGEGTHHPPRSTKLHLTLCQSKGLPLLKISKSIIMKYNYKSIPDETYDHVIAAHIRNNPHY